MVNHFPSFLGFTESRSKNSAFETYLNLRLWLLAMLASFLQASSDLPKPPAQITKLPKFTIWISLGKQILPILMKLSGLIVNRPSLPIVMIRVGKGESTSTFAIHKNILEHCSPFFDSIWTSDPASDTVHELNPREDSVESGTQVQKEELRNAKMESVIEVKLDADVAAFGLYTEWVYSGHIQKGSLKTENDDIDFSPIGQAYILGEKLQDQKFKNAIVDFLLRTIVTQGKMDLNLPMLIFNETSNSAPLRKFLVDLYVRYGHKDWLNPGDSKVTIPAVFLSDLSSALLDLHGHDGAPKAKIPALTVCNYHEHPDGEVCSNVTRHPRAIVEPKSEP